MRPARLFALAFAASAALASIPAPAAAGVSRGTHDVRIDAALSGRVLDPDGSPVADATVSIVELGRAARTGADGSFRFAALPTGRYTLSVRGLGFVVAAREVTVGDAPVVLSITLQRGALRIEPVNVTAARVPVDALRSPLATSVLTGEQVHEEGGISLAHSVANLPGVRSVSSGQQIGKPMIRGLFGPRVLVVADGSRLEDYSWSDEDGPSIDARMAERIEVIRGPASVLYGSEALGGVVNVVPEAVPSSSDGSSFRRGAIEAYGASNNIELGSAATAEGASGAYGWRLFGTGRVSQNYHTPDGHVPNSSFWAFNGDGALGIRQSHGSTTLRASHYGGEFHLLEASGPEAADPEGGPVRQVADDRLQATNDYVVGGLRLETKAQWQRHGLAEVSDDCVPTPPATTCTPVKDQKAFGLTLNTGTLDVLAHHTIGSAITGTVGVSGMYQSSSSEGPIFLVPSATIGNAALFAFEEASVGPVTFAAGGRADTRHLSADAQSQISRAADSRSWSSTSADGGIVVRALPTVALVANVASGWRAPTLFDLYTNGPNRADARFEIGDPTLATERATTFDGGIRWIGSFGRAEATLFDNRVHDFIYMQPTAAFQDSLRVYRHVQADARLQGGELAAELRVAEPLTLRASHDWVIGTNRESGEYLPLMPPPRTTFGAELRRARLGSSRNASFGAEVQMYARQTRLNPEDFPTAGYVLLNFDAGLEREVARRPLRFDLIVHNATNASYRDFLSRYKEFALGPGANVLFKVSAGAW